MSSTPPPPSTRALEEARQRLDRELAKHPEDAKLLLLRGRADERLERYEDAAAFFQRAAKVLRAEGDRAGEAAAVLEAASAYGRAGDFSRARLLFVRAVSTFEELPDAVGAGRARAAYARMLLDDGQAADAEEQLRLCVGALEQGEVWDTLGWAQERLVQLALAADDLEGALAAARSAVESAARAKDRPRFGAGLAQVARLHLASGNWGKARQYQERALPYLREAEAWVPLLEGYLMLIDGELAEGGVDRTEALIGEATEVADRVRKPMFQGRLRVRSGEVLLLRGDPARARALLQQGVELLQRAGDLRSSAPAFEALGRAQWRLGDRDAALVALDRAAWMHRQLGDAERAADVEAVRANAASGAWKG
ncbi:MAG: hypothetical protein R3F59_33860 [Myxococcota bacterium]